MIIIVKWYETHPQQKTAIDNGDHGDNDGDQQHNHYQQVSPSITIMNNGDQWWSI